jgi:hypothetical protein
VIGILDNSGILHANEISTLQKVEYRSNVGFISYQSDDPNSTVIMRNIIGGESNLVHALAYMQQYANTVEKPLIIEMALTGEELQNPLFIQVCQKNCGCWCSVYRNRFRNGVCKCQSTCTISI